MIALGIIIALINPDLLVYGLHAWQTMLLLEA